MAIKKNIKKKAILAIVLAAIIIVSLLLLRSCTIKKIEVTSKVDEYTQEETVDIDGQEEIAEEKVETIIEEEKTVDGYSYYVNFLNIDGSVLQRSVYKIGELPIYKGKTPTYSDGSYIYTFLDWDKAISKVSGTQTYRATYSRKTKQSSSVCNHTNYNIQSDGSWLCSKCGSLLKDTDDAYFTVLDSNGQPTTIQALTAASITGTNGISKADDTITYTNSSVAQDVVIRTNGGNLVITDTNNDSHQTHYGQVLNTTISTGNSCFVTHGIISKMQLTTGKAISENGGYVGLVKASSSSYIEEKNGGHFFVDETIKSSDVKDVKVVVDGINYDLSKLGFDTNNDYVDFDEAKEYESYEISSKEELYEFRDLINSGINIPLVKITNDIDISGDIWIPIGSFEHPYHGYISGYKNDNENYTIKGMNISESTLNADNSFKTHHTQIAGSAYGFIAIAGNGDLKVENLDFVDVNINIPENGNSVGAILGYAPSDADFYNELDYETQNTGSYTFEYDGKYFNPSDLETNTEGGYNIFKVDTKYYTGKIGFNGYGNSGAKNVTLNKINVSGNISANDSVGGLIGKSYNSGTLTITNCVSDEDVTSNHRAGGLVGYIRKDATNWNITGNYIGNENSPTIIMSNAKVGNNGVDQIAVFEYIGPTRVINKNNVYATMKYANNDQEQAYSLVYIDSNADNVYDKLKFTTNGKQVYYEDQYNALCTSFENCTIYNNIARGGLRTYGYCEIYSTALIDSVINKGNGTVNVYGGIFNKNPNKNLIPSGYNRVKVTSGENTYYIVGYGVTVNNDNEITGGIFNFDVSLYIPTEGYDCKKLGSNYVVGQNVTVNNDNEITGGKFNFNLTDSEYLATDYNSISVDSNTYIVGYKAIVDGDSKITGGKFNFNLTDSEYLAPDYNSVYVGSNTYVVGYKAIANNNKITDGIFNFKVSDFVAENYNCINVDSNIYYVGYGAKLSNNKISGGIFAFDPGQDYLVTDYESAEIDTKYIVGIDNVSVSEGKITGGRFKFDLTDSGYLATDYNSISVDSNTYIVGYKATIDDNNMITGGLFTFKVYSKYIANGYDRKKLDSDTYVVGKDVFVNNNKITGGTFTFNPQDYVDTDTYTVNEGDNNSWSVVEKSS